MPDIKIYEDRLITSSALTSSITININSSMSQNDIQALIDNAPRNLNRYVLTFQFADGMYTITSTLLFRGFIGGMLRVWGNTSEGTSLYTSQAVQLNGSSAGAISVIQFDICPCLIEVRNIKFTVPNILNAYGLRFTFCLSCSILYNYFIATGKSNTNYGIYVASVAAASAQVNYVSNLVYAIAALRTTLLSNNNQSTGTGPNYGLRAAEGATISKTSTQPTGTTGNESVSAATIL